MTRALSRRSFLAALGTAGVSAAAACARPSPPTPGDTPTTQPVKVTYWKSLSGPRHDAQVRLVDEFNASQARVRVTLEHAGEYGPAAEKLRVALASGGAPDTMLLSVNTDLPQFARLDALRPLDALVKRAPEQHTFYPGFLNDGRVDGALYQLPFARSVPLLYANRGLLAAAGVPEAGGAPATWEAYLDVLRRVRAARPEEPAAGVTTSWSEFQAALWAFGGAYSDAAGAPLTSASKSLEAFQFWADLVQRHGVAAATKRAQPEFLAGGRAFLVGTSAALTEIVDSAQTAQFRVGVSPLPATGSPVPGGGAGLVLLAGSPKSEAAWEFLRFMTSAESAAAFSGATGYTPVRPDALAQPPVRTLLARYPGAVIALAEVGRVRPVDAILARSGAGTLIQNAIERMVFAGEAVRQTCEALTAALARLPAV